MKFVLLLLTIISSSQMVFAGGSEVGNPTDNLPPEFGSAWFLNSNNLIKACYRVSPEFGAKPEEVEAAIQNAFQTWQEYLEQRQVLGAMSRDYGLTFAWHYTLSKDCIGNEDLKFEFGTSSPAIQKEKSRLNNPTGFSVRESYDIAKGWGKGFIWLAPAGSIDAEKGFPAWSKGNTLKLIVLHELGHVYGCPHVRGTVMDEFLSRDLQTNPNYLNQVDQRNQLVFCWMCVSSNFSGSLGYSDQSSEDSESRVFARFVGRQPDGHISARLLTTTEGMNLLLSDSIGQKIIPLQVKIGSVHTGFDRGDRIFRAVTAASPHLPPQIFDFFNGGQVQYGSVKDAKGRLLNLIIEINSHSLMAPGPYTLRWIDAGKAHSLFFSNPS